jgi:hypothetical protein
LAGPGEATEVWAMSERVTLVLSLTEIVTTVISWVQSKFDTFVFYPAEKSGLEKPLLVQVFRSPEYMFEKVYLFNGELVLQEKDGRVLTAKVPKEWLEFEGLFRLLGRKGWRKNELLKRLEKFKV